MIINAESPGELSANPYLEIDLDNYWHEQAQTFLSFLSNTRLRDCLTQRMEEVYSINYDLQSPLKKAQERSRIKSQIQECGAILEGLLNDCLNQDFKEEILEWYGKNGIHRVRDIPMNNKADFAAQKGIITEELKVQICDAYHLRSNNHVDREIRKNYVPSPSDAQKTLETLEELVSQLKAYLGESER